MGISDRRIVIGSNADVVLELFTTDRSKVNAVGTPTVTIYDPNETKVVDAVAMTSESLGTYVYNFQTTDTMLTGTYAAFCRAEVASSRYEVKVLQFEVSER